MRKTQRFQSGRKRRAISPVISTLIISASVLVVTGIASFLALNVLELQSQQTEFDQARSNMQILASIIEDTGVKPGAGSFIRFNERTGGLGYVDTNPLTVTTKVNGAPADLLISVDKPLNLTYRGGRLVSTFDENVTGTPDLMIEGLATPMGFISQQQANGAWLNLDFNRVRIVTGNDVTVGNNKYQVVTVTFFKVSVDPGNFTGSGNLEVKVQNEKIQPTQYTYSGDVTITVSHGTATKDYTITKAGSSAGIIVMVNVSDLKISTL